MAQSAATFIDGEGLYLSDRWRLTRWPTNLNERRELHDTIITFGSITSGSPDGYFDRLHTVTPYSDGPCITDLSAAIAFDLGLQRAEAVASSNLPEVARLNAAERDFRECSPAQFSDEVWRIDPFTSLPTKLQWIRAQRMAAILRGLDQSPSTAGVTSAVEVTASMNSASPEPPVPIEPDAIFRREGDIWTMVFAGKTVHLQHLQGLSYIADLLRKPREPIEAAELARISVEPTGLLVMSGIELTTKDGIKAVRNELTTKESELAGLHANDWTRRGALKDEIKQLKGYLAQVETPQGQPRRVGGTAQRARSSVTNAINRAVNYISGQHPDLGRHLKRSIKTGTVLIYSPAEVPDWSF